MKQIFKSLFDEFKFGKFKGEILDIVYQNDLNYIVWLYENRIIDFDEDLKDRLKI